MAEAKTPSPGERSWAEQVVRDQKRVYQEFVKTAHHLRRMRALRLTGRAPRSFQALLGRGVRVPMSWSLVQTVVGMIAKNTPTFRRVPRNELDKDASMRLATSAWPLIETYSRMAKKPLYYLLADQLAGDGRAVFKMQRTILEGYPLRIDYGGDKEYNKAVEDYLNEKQPQPVRAALIDPTTFWPSREEYDTSYVVESGRRPLLTTMKSLGLKFGTNNKLLQTPVGATMTELEIPAGLSPTAAVDIVTTDENHFISVDGEWLKFENEFGFINYGWRFGQVTSINDPMLESTSIIFPFAGVEPWLNTLFSVVLAWSVLGGTPILAVHTQPHQNLVPGDDTPPADIPLGKMVSPGVGKTLQFITPPPVGAEVLQAIEMLMSIYDRAGITSGRRGILGSRTPASTYGSAMEAAGDMFTPLVKGLEGILEDMVTMTWRAVEAFDTPIFVTGHSLEPILGRSRSVLSPWKIDPADIKGYYDLHCELKLSNLQDTISRGMHAAFMNAHELWSWDRSSSYGGVEDPLVERIEILKDRLRKSPLFQEQVLKPALAEDPTLGPVVQQAEQAGIPLATLLEQGTAALQGAPSQQPTSSGGEPGGGAGTYEGAPQPRGMPAPGAGGRAAGMPRRPTGPRQTKQGGQFPK